MRVKREPILFLLLICIIQLSAQTPIIVAKDSLRTMELLTIRANHPNNRGGETMVRLGSALLDTPYVGGTLEGNKQEQLVINLSELDCTTFVENLLALTICKTESLHAYAEALRQIRYRGGKIEGYASRLHYFSEWIAENEKQGVIKEVTRLHPCAEPLDKKIDFMSAHPNYYPALIDNSKEMEKIREAEKRISSNNTYYIPKSNLASEQLRWIESGDVIAITTTIKGLDVVHVGIAVRQGEEVHLLHASSDAKRVILDPRTLEKQLANNKNQSGIRVLRLASNPQMSYD